MTTTGVGAYQEMCERIRAIVTAPVVTEIVGYLPELRYSDVNYGKQPANDKLWLRFTMAESREKARTLGKPARVTYAGVAGVQLFVPVTDTKAAERIRKVADHIKSAFANSTANVNFYKATVKGVPPDAAWFVKRIDAEYQYVELVK